MNWMLKLAEVYGDGVCSIRRRGNSAETLEVVVEISGNWVRHTHPGGWERMSGDEKWEGLLREGRDAFRRTFTYREIEDL